MGAITAILPLVIEAFKLAPSLVEGGSRVYEGAKEIWYGITADEAPTTEQKATYEAAELAAFNALMKSTDDVKEEGDLER